MVAAGLLLPTPAIPILLPSLPTQPLSSVVRYARVLPAWHSSFKQCGTGCGGPPSSPPSFPACGHIGRSDLRDDGHTSVVVARSTHCGGRIPAAQASFPSPVVVVLWLQWSRGHDRTASIAGGDLTPPSDCIVHLHVQVAFWCSRLHSQSTPVLGLVFLVASQFLGWCGLAGILAEVELLYIVGRRRGNKLVAMPRLLQVML